MLAALGVYIFMEARDWAYYSDDGPGPAFFPVWYGVAMVVLSLALIVDRRSPSSRRPDDPTGRASGAR